jgi:hypothetical protein
MSRSLRRPLVSTTETIIYFISMRKANDREEARFRLGHDHPSPATDRRPASACRLRPYERDGGAAHMQDFCDYITGIVRKEAIRGATEVAA